MPSMPELEPLLPVPLKLDADKIRYLVRGFSSGWDYNTILARYVEYWKEEIQPVVIMQIEREYAAEIEQSVALEKQRQARLVLGEAEYRLETLKWGLERAKLPKVVRSVREGPVGAESWVPIEEEDLEMVARFIDLGRKEEHGAKTLLMQAIKLDIDASRIRQPGVPKVSVDAGTWEAEEVNEVS